MKYRFKNGKLMKIGKFRAFINRIIIKIIHFFTKWKLINSDIHYIIPKDEWIFRLSTLERARAEAIMREKGNVDFLFCPTEIGNCVYVIVRETGEKIDITDCSLW